MSRDLQEDIDIGLSRSTDCGQTWEPVKVIMDMGEYGSLPQALNGSLKVTKAPRIKLALKKNLIIKKTLHITIIFII